MNPIDSQPNGLASGQSVTETPAAAPIVLAAPKRPVGRPRKILTRTINVVRQPDGTLKALLGRGSPPRKAEKMVVPFNWTPEMGIANETVVA